MAGGLTLISHADPFIQVPRRQERIATSARSSPCPPVPLPGKLRHPRAAVGCSESSWRRGTPLFPGPLWCMRLRLAGSRPRAARRGSALGYFNERCQGLQRGEERREKPSTLSKLGVGRGGLVRCCGAASATHSAPAGPLRRSGSGYGGFFPLSPLSLPCSSLSLTFAAFVCAGWGMGPGGRDSP